MSFLRRLAEEGGDRPLRPPRRRAGAGGLGPDRPRAGHDRAARLPRLLPGGLGHRRVLPASTTSSARGGARPPTRRSATPSGSPTPTPCASACSSSGSSPPSATGPPTSTWTSRSAGGRRPSSTSTSRYGRGSAAQVANVITYRPRSAVRDIGKALGARPGASSTPGPSRSTPWAAGSDGRPKAPTAGRPRHPRRRWWPWPPSWRTSPAISGIHSGGMVICDRPGDRGLPGGVGPHGRPHASCSGTRTTAPRSGWSSSTCSAWGCSRRCTPRSTSSRASTGSTIDLAALPQEDGRLRDALPGRLGRGVPGREPGPDGAPCPGSSPRTFYDLVVEVALIRPGPIQGGSVHPYIRRRNGQEEVTYLHPLLEPSLEQDPRGARCSRSS